MRMIALTALLIAGNVAAGTIASGCTLQAADPDILAKTAGGITLEGGDGNSEAPLWLGPIHTPACSLEVDLFGGPLAVARDRFLFVVQVSGSQQRVTQYDLQSCKQRWQSAPLFGQAKLLKDGYQIGKKLVRFGPQCQPARRGH
ncbi:hypothetical protein SAMN02745857_02022 [Andreprevotia lacus DSM 23236]|jgi:hypothetical protein|uniref:Lipoprotein n=1 Tax=Andreprevotia lacus DSM 23236 TaxID=1121001 RepID=A0A1W1XLU9_9NEIS|nr:hypothetical protein [Andreprevotia lacus]SMC24970.1 hypothetical protein SAMN02745857_02022 [Andreprevotia lacus DSM 23236]